MILEGYGAVRGYYACFVNPNATCPVCGAPVYYYENSHRSRVFFDDLGKPWPVHGCTGQPPAIAGRAISRRPAGQIEEIHYCRNVLSGEPAMDFETSYRTPPSYVVSVEECIRRGLDNYIKGAPLVGDAEVVFVRFTSAKVIPGPGDLLSIRGGEVSIFIDGTKKRAFKMSFIDTETFANAVVSERGDPAQRDSTASGQ